MTKPATGPGAIVFWVLVFAVCAVPACRRSASADANGPTMVTASTQTVAQDQDAPTAAQGAAVSTETLQAVCAGTCAGPFAVITVWRDAGGAVGRIVMQGDLQRCSDPPMVYFDANGQVTEQIGLQPVVVGSPEQQAFTERRNRQLAGLTEAEHLSCGTPP